MYVSFLIDCHAITSKYTHTFPVCGDELVEGAVTAPVTDCSMACGGNSAYAVSFFHAE